VTAAMLSRDNMNGEGGSLPSQHFRRRPHFWVPDNKDRRRESSNEERIACRSAPKSPPRIKKWVLAPTSVKAAVIMLLLPSVFLILVIVRVGRTLGIRFFPKKLRDHRPPLYGIAKPASHIKISVVIMNHDRPQVLQQSTLLPTLAQHDSVSEILLLHSCPKSAFTANETLASRIHDEMHLKKIRDMDAVAMNEKMGLALRFHFCAMSARNDWVLVLDDDMELDSTAIDALLYHMQKDPKRLVGHFGRSLVPPNIVSRLLFHRSNFYDTKTVYGAVEVVLTKVLLLERDICVQFLKHMHLMDDLVAGSKPLWNGEDLFGNLVANRHYGVPYDGPYRNLAVAGLPVWEANIPVTKSKDDVASISGNLDDHRIWTVRYTAILPIEFILNCLGRLVSRSGMWRTRKLKSTTFIVDASGARPRSVSTSSMHDLPKRGHSEPAYR
jgi:Glycosyl transferase family 64 domain